jgi:uncharacterized membrane protein YoaK (UPF0700 family)
VKVERFEGIVQVLILIAVAGMAGAGSFTHVHDWTMSNVPTGTGSWLGWANAVITELVPAAAGIEIRRRKRQHRPVTYPMTILVTDAVISVGVQLSDAKHTFVGSLAFALPALAFLALTKLVLSRARSSNQEEPGLTTTAVDQPPLAAQPPQALTPDQLRELDPVPSGQLLASARMTAFAHHQATGNPITASEIADRLGVPPALAESLLERIDGTPPPVTEANGTVMNGSRP